MFVDDSASPAPADSPSYAYPRTAGDHITFIATWLFVFLNFIAICYGGPIFALGLDCLFGLPILCFVLDVSQ